MTVHEWPIRVYYEDTDAGGIVYYANYLKFAERGRTELLRSLGFSNKSLMDEKGIAFVVRRIEADYISPAHLDDELVIKTSVDEINNASFVMKQTLFRGNLLLFSVDVVLVSINETKKPVRLPDDIKAALSGDVVERSE